MTQARSQVSNSRTAVGPGPFRFAIIGCGVIARTHAESLLQLAKEDVVLAACVDTIPERSAALARQFDTRSRSLQDVLDDPSIDAVTVCTPSGLHASIGIHALDAGKNVIVEKPMDVTVDACDALLAAQARSGRRLAVISQHRFDSATVAVREAITSGYLGRIIGADVRVPWYRTQDYYDSGDWRGTWELDGGGCLMNQGVHTVDLMLSLCGPVQSVYAQARTSAHDRIAVEDIISATLTFESGAIGSLLASTATYPGYPARLAVYGDRGSAIIEGDSLAALSSMNEDSQSDTGTQTGSEAHLPSLPADHALRVASGGTRAALATAASDPNLAWGDGHREQIRDFVRCCREGGNAAVDGVAGRLAVATITAIYESARTDAPVILGGLS